jgi:hypothetical protein
MLGKVVSDLGGGVDESEEWLGPGEDTIGVLNIP